MTTAKNSTCCGKCEKAELGTCTKLRKVLAGLKPPVKEKPRAV
ncbi:hypothetical protein [Ruegeria sp. HKCCD8929]|nr:hypothetical protein [Ruegeria sp. HKCCD8929]